MARTATFVTTSYVIFAACWTRARAFTVLFVATDTTLGCLASQWRDSLARPMPARSRPTKQVSRCGGSFSTALPFQHLRHIRHAPIPVSARTMPISSMSCRLITCGNAVMT